MSDLYASLSGIRVVSAHLTTSTYGAAVADVVLATADTLPAKCSLTIGNLTIACHVYRQAQFAGQRTARIVGGAGGWHLPVAPRTYQLGAIPLSMVLRDAAADVGETVNVATDSTIGTYYVREAGPASRVLKQLVGREWWIDAAGVTQIGPRPATTIATPFLAVKKAGSSGKLEIATEDPAAWMPGASFSNALVTRTTIASVSFTLSADSKLRVEVLSTRVGGDDRILSGFRDLVRAEDPGETFAGVWEYSVAAARAAGGVVTFDGHPTASDVPLPPAVGWPIRPGVAGASFVPAAGSLVLVAFANRDPRRPVVVGFDGNAPGQTAIDSTGAMALGASASRVSIAGGSVVVPAGSEAGRALRIGDILAGPVATGVPYTLALAVPGTTPVSKVTL